MARGGAFMLKRREHPMPMSIGVEFNSTGTENFNIDPLQWKEENLNGLS